MLSMRPKQQLKLLPNKACIIVGFEAPCFHGAASNPGNDVITECYGIRWCFRFCNKKDLSRNRKFFFIVFYWRCVMVIINIIYYI